MGNDQQSTGERGRMFARTACYAPRIDRAAIRFLWVWRWDKGAKLLRVCRWYWATGDDATVKGWHSSKLSIALTPRLWNRTPELWGWSVTILGVRLHRKRAYGGWTC
jgi:hypothetical protein